MLCTACGISLGEALLRTTAMHQARQQRFKSQHKVAKGVHTGGLSTLDFLVGISSPEGEGEGEGVGAGAGAGAGEGEGVGAACGCGCG